MQNFYQENTLRNVQRFTHTNTTFCIHKYNSLDYQYKLQKLSFYQRRNIRLLQDYSNRQRLTTCEKSKMTCVAQTRLKTTNQNDFSNLKRKEKRKKKIPPNEQTFASVTQVLRFLENKTKTNYIRLECLSYYLLPSLCKISDWAHGCI